MAIDPKRSALIIQDLQNDVIAEGGAFADSGAPAHAQSQNIVENVKNLAQAARDAGMPVIHVHYIVDKGAAGLKQNAPLFQGVKEAAALVRGSWGAAPVDGLEPQPGDFVVRALVLPQPAQAPPRTRLQRLRVLSAGALDCLNRVARSPAPHYPQTPSDQAHSRLTSAITAPQTPRWRPPAAGDCSPPSR